MTRARTIDVSTTLKQSKLFRLLSVSELGEATRSFRSEHWARRTSLPPGRSMEHLTVVAAGRLEVMRYHPESNRRLTVFLLEPGDGFDVVTFLDGEMHDVVVETVGPVETLCAPLSVARRWFDQWPSFEHAVLHEAAHQLRQLEDLAADVVLVDTATRLGHAILRYAEPGSGQNGALHGVVRGLSHDTLARMIGSVRAVVNRYLQELRSVDAVHLERNEIHINNLNALMDRANRAHAPVEGKPPRAEAGGLEVSHKKSQN